jgi:hypothetical protein
MMEVYVRPLGGAGERVQVSLDGASEPVWSRDGREIFYRRLGANPELVAAAVDTRPGFRVVGRTSLFPDRVYEIATPHANYDVSPDGRSFVMIRRSSADRMVVLQNLPELVRRIRQNGGRQ